MSNRKRSVDVMADALRSVARSGEASAVAVHIYKKKKEIAMFRENGTPTQWFKFLPETPRHFAELESKLFKRPISQEPCWWGQGDRTPEQDGYERIDTWKVFKE